jgi:hypothetical protein
VEAEEGTLSPRVENAAGRHMPANPWHAASPVPTGEFAGSEELLRCLVKDLSDQDSEVRASALSRLTFFATDAKKVRLTIIRALNDVSEEVRRAAQACLFTMYPQVHALTDLPGLLNNNRPEVRLAGIRAVVRLLPEIQEAIAARAPGWDFFAELTAHPTSENPASPTPPHEGSPASSEKPGSATEGPMEQARNPGGKRGAARPTQGKRGETPAALASPRVHLIRIPDAEARQRAIVVFGEVRFPYCGFTDYRMLVSNEHLDVLSREKIPFEVMS